MNFQFVEQSFLDRFRNFWRTFLRSSDNSSWDTPDGSAVKDPKNSAIISWLPVDRSDDQSISLSRRLAALEIELQDLKNLPDLSDADRSALDLSSAEDDQPDIFATYFSNDRISNIH